MTILVISPSAPDRSVGCDVATGHEVEGLLSVVSAARLLERKGAAVEVLVERRHAQTVP
jgi:hypothetical protein